ncbi:MAG: hypothetical protein ABR951_11915 [Candidatus Aminicenantales bacterium]|jgi:hypothetical protein
MVSCKIIDALYAMVPSRLLRNFLIRSHIERCGHCQARLVSRTEAEALFVKSGEVRAGEELWKRIERRTGQDTAVPEKKPAWLRWEWAAGAATFLVLAAASLWLLRGVQTVAVRADYARPAGRFEINYINVGGAPAQAYIYQPAGSDMIIVWAGRTP